MQPENPLYKELITVIVASFQPSQVAQATRKINELSKRPNYFKSIIDMLSIRDPLTTQYMNQSQVKDSNLQINTRCSLLTLIKNQIRSANSINISEKVGILSSEVIKILSINWDVKTEKILKYLIELIIRQLKTSEWAEQSSIMFLGVLDNISNNGCNKSDEFTLDKILTVLNGFLLGILHISSTRVLDIFVQILCKYLTPVMRIVDRYAHEFSRDTMDRMFEFGTHILSCWRKYINQNVMGIQKHFQMLIQVKKLCYLGYHFDEKRDYSIQSEYFDKYYFFLISIAKEKQSSWHGLTQDINSNLFNDRQDQQLVQHKMAIFIQHYHQLEDQEIRYILIFIKCCSGLISDAPNLSLFKNALLQLISVEVNKKIKDQNYDPPKYYDELNSQIFWGSLNQPSICQPKIKIAITLWRIVSEIENDSDIDFITTKQRARKQLQMRKQYVNLNTSWRKQKKQCYRKIIENVYSQSKTGILCYEKSRNLNQGALQEDYDLMISLLKSQEIQEKLMGLEIFEHIYKTDHVFIRSGQKSIYLWHYVIPNLRHENKLIRRRCFQLLETCVADFLFNKSYITNLVNCVTTAILKQTDPETSFIVLQLISLIMGSQPWKSFIHENINEILNKYENYFRANYQLGTKVVDLMDCFYSFLDEKHNVLLTNNRIPSIFQSLINILILNDSEVANSRPMNNVLIFMTDLCQNPQMEVKMRQFLMILFKDFLKTITIARQNQGRPDMVTDCKLEKIQQILSSYLSIVNKQCDEHLHIYICAYRFLSHFHQSHEQSLDHLVQQLKLQIESGRQKIQIFHRNTNISLCIHFVELMASLIIEKDQSQNQNNQISKQQVEKILNRQESRQYRYNQLFSQVFKCNFSIRFESLFFKAINNLYTNLQKLLFDSFQPNEISEIVISNFQQYITPNPERMVHITLQLKKKGFFGINQLNALALKVIEDYCFQFKDIIFESVLQDIWKAITSMFNLILLDGRQMPQNMIRLQNIIGVLICSSPTHIIKLAHSNQKALTFTHLIKLMLVKSQFYHSEGIDGISLSQKINILSKIDAFSKIKIEAICRILQHNLVLSDKPTGKYCNELMQAIDFYFIENKETQSQLSMLTLGFEGLEQEIDMDLNELLEDEITGLHIRQYGYPYSITSINIKDIIQQTFTILSNKKSNKEPVYTEAIENLTNKLLQLFIN